MHAHVFFMSYTLDRTAGTPPRPLTFVWNGGPGSSVSQPHLLGFGPRIVKMDVDYGTARPFSESEMEDNQETWLTATDLVFVRTPSAPATAGRRAPSMPLSFIRPVATRSRLRSSFVSIASGLTRSARRCSSPVKASGPRARPSVADVLARWRIPLRGAVLAALSLPLGDRSAVLRAALAVPTYTAVAFYWKRLAPDLQANRVRALAESEEWASGEYARALARRDSLSEPERRAVVERLARFSGLDATSIDARTLTINSQRYSRELLAKEGKLLGLYDIRRNAPSPRDSAPRQYDPTTDPSLVPQLLHMNGNIGAVDAIHSRRARVSQRPSIPGSLRWRVSGSRYVPRRLDVHALGTRRGRRRHRERCDSARWTNASAAPRDGRQSRPSSSLDVRALRHDLQLLREYVGSGALGFGARVACDRANVRRWARGVPEQDSASRDAARRDSVHSRFNARFQHRDAEREPQL